MSTEKATNNEVIPVKKNGITFHFCNSCGRSKLIVWKDSKTSCIWGGFFCHKCVKIILI